MSNSHDIEKFDQSFRDKLNSPLNDSDRRGPSEDLWMAIEQGLPPERKTRPKWWIWPGLLLLFFGMAFFLWPEQEVNTSYESMAVRQVESANLPHSTFKLENTEPSGAIANKNWPAKRGPNAQVTSKQIVSVDRKAKSRDLEKLNKSKSGDISQADQVPVVAGKQKIDYSGSQILKILNTIDQIPGEDALTTAIEPKSKVFIPQLSTISFLLATETRAKPELVHDLESGNENIGQKKKYPNALSVYGGTSLLYGQMNQNYSEVLKPFDFYQEAQAGYDLGVNLTTHLSRRISISAGIQYNAFNLTTGHNSFVQYDSNQEVRTGDYFVINDSQVFATPYGTIGAEVNLGRSVSSEAPNDRIMDLDIRMIQSFRRISTPVNIRYAVLSKPRFAIQVLVGTAFGVTFDDETRLDHLGVNNLHFQNHNSTIENKLGQLKNLSLGYQAGVQLEYNLNENFGLFFNTTYTRDINPIFNTESFRTIAAYTSINAGVTFFLKK